MNKPLGWEVLEIHFYDNIVVAHLFVLNPTTKEKVNENVKVKMAAPKTI